MRFGRICGVLPALLISGIAISSIVRGQTDAALTMKQLMLERIHPASNALLLVAYRGAPENASDWSAIENTATQLQSAAAALLEKNKQTEWSKAASLLATAAVDAGKAAQQKDATAFGAIAVRIDASCTNCHTRYRPNVFPGERAN